MRRFIGLDLHRDYVHAYAWAPGEKGRHFRFPNAPEAWPRFIREQLDQDAWVAMEATGNAFEVYDLLSPHAGKVLVANPLALKRYGSGRHTDRADAERLARALAMGTLPGVWVPPQEIRELRQLLAYRESLVRDRVRANNRAKATLRRYGIRIPQNADPLKWPGDERLDLPEAARVIVASSLKQAKHLADEVEAITQEIVRRIAPHPRARQLMSLPGFGPVVTAAVIALVGEPTRFRRAKQVSRFAGLDPSVHQSGETDRRGRISKNGAPLLRKLLIQAAYQLVRTGTGPLAEFQRRKAATLGGKRAIVAVARKLLIAAWRLWQTDRLANEVKLKTYQRKMRELDKKASVPAYPVSETLRGLLQNTDGSRDQDRAAA